MGAAPSLDGFQVAAKVQKFFQSDNTRRCVGVVSELMRFCDFFLYNLTLQTRISV